VKRYLRRFAAVGVLVTAVDASVVVALRVGAGVPVVLADAVAIGVAAVLSYVLHRAFTFTDDPFVRWVREPATYTTITVAAGLIDVLLLRLLAVGLDTNAFWPLLAAKAVSLTAAGTLRMYGYRRLLFEVVRDEQGRRVDRGPAPGDVRLSVVIPAYKEAEQIGAVIDPNQHHRAVVIAGRHHRLAGMAGHDRYPRLAPGENGWLPPHRSVLAVEWPEDELLRAGRRQEFTVRCPRQRAHPRRIARHAQVLAVGDAPAVQHRLLHRGDDEAAVRADGDAEM
jgi:putative flippase GtrA